MNTGESTDWGKKYSVWSAYRLVYGMLWRHGRKILAVDAGKIVTNVAAQLMSVIIPAAVIALLESGKGMKAYLLGVLALFLLSALLYSAQSYFNSIPLLKTIFRSRYVIRTVMEEICKADYAWMERKDTQENLAKAVRGGSQGMEEFMDKNTELLLNLLGLAVYIGTAAALEPRIILLLLAISGLQMGIYALARSYEESHKEERGGLWAKQWYHEGVTDDISAGKDIRLFGLRPWLLQYYEGYAKRVKRMFAKERGVYFAYDLSVLVMSFLRDLVCYGYLLARMTQGMSMAEFAFYLGIVAGFSGWFSRIADSLTVLGGSILNIKDYQRWIDAARRTHDTGELVHERETMEIAFENVSFSYPDSEKKVLDGVSFTLNPGKKTALVGLNGAGKTTVVKLLCGLYRPTTGRILIDGTDLRLLNREKYFEKLSAIFQEPLLLESGIDENIACEIRERLEPGRCRRAAERAGLLEKLRELPRGMQSSYGNVLDPDGVYLSGGECQKLLLARALYKDAPAVLLDEPTAAMDALAERETYRVYERELKGKTVLFISHRLASTRFCDEILFLENGKLTERGTHEELLRAQGGYAELFEVQSRYYREEKGGKTDAV